MRLKSRNLQVISFGFLEIDQFPIAPKSKLGNAVIQRINADIDLVSRRNVIEFHNEAIDGYLPVRVNGSAEPETEDIFDGLPGRVYFEFSE